MVSLPKQPARSVNARVGAVYVWHSVTLSGTQWLSVTLSGALCRSVSLSEGLSGTLALGSGPLDTLCRFSRSVRSVSLRFFGLYTNLYMRPEPLGFVLSLSPLARRVRACVWLGGRVLTIPPVGALVGRPTGAPCLGSKVVPDELARTAAQRSSDLITIGKSKGTLLSSSCESVGEARIGEH